MRFLPKRKHLVDLFCGGCAVSHAALLIGKYEHVRINDINARCPTLFRDAVEGNYHNETRWISREDFARLKDADPYVAFVWSFGNNLRSYMYSTEIEPWKKALHYARVLGDYSLMEEFGIHTDGSRADIIAHHDEYKKKYIRWWLAQQEYSAEELDALIERCKGDIAVQEEELRQYLLDGLKSSGLTQAEVGRRLGTQMTGHYFRRSQWEFPTEEYYNMMRTFMPALDKDYNEVIGLHNLWQSLESLQRLERLQSLESLQRLERLESFVLDYAEVEIPKDSVIYCDIPYEGTDGYNGAEQFDYERFYRWAESQTEPVFISSYDMPHDRFDCVMEWRHRSILSGRANNAVTERLFVPKKQKERGNIVQQLTLFD